MHKKLWLIAAFVMASVGISGCVPLVVAGGVIVADEVVEHEKGGDGLF